MATKTSQHVIIVGIGTSTQLGWIGLQIFIWVCSSGPLWKWILNQLNIHWSKHRNLPHWPWLQQTKWGLWGKAQQPACQQSSCCLIQCHYHLHLGCEGCHLWSQENRVDEWCHHDLDNKTWPKIFTWLASKQISKLFTHCIATVLVSLESHCHCSLAELADLPSHSLGQSGVALAGCEWGLGVVQGEFCPHLSVMHSPMIWALLAVLACALKMLLLLELVKCFSPFDHETHHLHSWRIDLPNIGTFWYTMLQLTHTILPWFGTPMWVESWNITWFSFCAAQVWMFGPPIWALQVHGAIGRVQDKGKDSKNNWYAKEKSKERSGMRNGHAVHLLLSSWI